MNKEMIMNIRTKIAIFLVAVLLSLVGFSLIASPSAVSLFKAGQLNGYSIDVVASAKTAPAVVRING
jgi:hypothetical protein